MNSESLVWDSLLFYTRCFLLSRLVSPLKRSVGGRCGREQTLLLIRISFFPQRMVTRCTWDTQHKLLTWPSRRRHHTAPRGATQLEPQGWLCRQEKKGKKQWSYQGHFKCFHLESVVIVLKETCTAHLRSPRRSPTWVSRIYTRSTERWPSGWYFLSLKPSR